MGVWECKLSPATDGSPSLSALMRVAIFVLSFCFQDMLGCALPSNRSKQASVSPLEEIKHSFITLGRKNIQADGFSVLQSSVSFHSNGSTV